MEIVGNRSCEPTRKITQRHEVRKIPKFGITWLQNVSSHTGYATSSDQKNDTSRMNSAPPFKIWLLTHQQELTEPTIARHNTDLVKKC